MDVWYCLQATRYEIVDLGYGGSNKSVIHFYSIHNWPRVRATSNGRPNHSKPTCRSPEEIFDPVWRHNDLREPRLSCRLVVANLGRIEGRYLACLTIEARLGIWPGLKSCRAQCNIYANLSTLSVEHYQKRLLPIIIDGSFKSKRLLTERSVSQWVESNISREAC